MSNLSDHNVNYTHQKARYGGIPGTIQQHAMEGIIIDKDPNNIMFREKLPGGFLPCNGRVQNVKDYYCLANALGIGDECRFKKDHVTLRNPDPENNDLGSFQLPDLGSKVIIGGRGTGEYRATRMDDDDDNSANRVGVKVDPYSNVGTRLYCNYAGNMTATGQPNLEFNGNIRYNMDRKTSKMILSPEHFQGHAHNMTGLSVLNYSGAHSTDGSGMGGVNTANAANASGGNTMEETQMNVPSGDPWHEHTILRPYTYTHSFQYDFPSFEIPLDDMYSYIDVDTEDLEVLNQCVTPFIMVHYIIKF